MTPPNLRVLVVLVWLGVCVARVPDSEMQALKDFYISLGGPKWDNNLFWPHPDDDWSLHDACLFAGITCTLRNAEGSTVVASACTYQRETASYPCATGKANNATLSFCDETTVVALDLPYNGLRGAIPESLADLPNLEVINLWRSAGLSRAVLDWDLTLLTGNFNQFDGHYPRAFSSLRKLKRLFLDEQGKLGPMPVEWANLVELEELAAFGFTGSYPIEYLLPKLAFLYLYQNGFLSGPIPESVRYSPRLEILFLGSTSITGTIPAWLGELTQLRDLYLNACYLHGTIPPELGKLKNLELLALGPDLEGTLPPSIAQLPKLKVIFLMSNPDLTGPLPPFSSLSLGRVFLLENNFNGTLPLWMRHKIFLQSIFVNGNSFSGVIPSDYMLEIEEAQQKPTLSVLRSQIRLYAEAALKFELADYAQLLDPLLELLGVSSVLDVSGGNPLLAPIASSLATPIKAMIEPKVREGLAALDPIAAMIGAADAYTMPGGNTPVIVEAQTAVITASVRAKMAPLAPLATALALSDPFDLPGGNPKFIDVNAETASAVLPALIKPSVLRALEALQPLADAVGVSTAYDIVGSSQACESIPDATTKAVCQACPSTSLLGDCLVSGTVQTATVCSLITDATFQEACLLCPSAMTLGQCAVFGAPKPEGVCDNIPDESAAMLCKGCAATLTLGECALDATWQTLAMCDLFPTGTYQDVCKVCPNTLTLGECLGEAQIALWLNATGHTIGEKDGPMRKFLEPQVEKGVRENLVDFEAITNQIGLAPYDLPGGNAVVTAAFPSLTETVSALVKPVIVSRLQPLQPFADAAQVPTPYDIPGGSSVCPNIPDPTIAGACAQCPSSMVLGDCVLSAAVATTRLCDLMPEGSTRQICAACPSSAVLGTCLREATLDQMLMANPYKENQALILEGEAHSTYKKLTRSWDLKLVETALGVQSIFDLPLTHRSLTSLAVTQENLYAFLEKNVTMMIGGLTPLAAVRGVCSAGELRLSPLSTFGTTTGVVKALRSITQGAAARASLPPFSLSDLAGTTTVPSTVVAANGTAATVQLSAKCVAVVAALGWDLSLCAACPAASTVVDCIANSLRVANTLSVCDLLPSFARPFCSSCPSSDRLFDCVMRSFVASLYDAMTVCDFLPPFERAACKRCDASLYLGSCLAKSALDKLDTYRFFEFMVNANQFKGPVPKPSSSLQDANLSDNQLSGSLPDFKNSTRLIRFKIGNNNLTGELPPTFCHLKSINQFEAAFNRLSGPIPDCFGNHTKLQSLQLQQNDFNGTVPESLGLCHNMSTLNLGSNFLAGTLPYTLGDIAALQSLDLSTNSFNDSFNRFMTTFKYNVELVSINIANNHFHGDISPPNLYTLGVGWAYPKLTTLLASNNSLSFKLAGLIQLPSLSVLDLSGNNISGIIPEAYAKASVLNVMGNPHLVSLTEDLPMFVVPTDNYVESNDGYSCPILDGRYQRLRIDIDSDYYNRSYCRCQLSYFGSKGRCNKCLEHATCPGGPTGFGNVAPLIVSHGFAPMPPNLSEHQLPEMLVPCYPRSKNAWPCNPEGKETWECLTGHGDRLCSRCQVGYYSQARMCVPCQYTVSLVLFVLILLLLFCCYLLLIFKVGFFMRFKTGLKNFLFYLQMTSLLFRVDLFDWDAEVLRFDSMYSWSNINFSIFACLFSDSSSFSDAIQLSLLLVVPVAIGGAGLVISALGALFYVRKARVHNHSWTSDAWRWFGHCSYATLFLLNFMYLPIASRVLRVFQCTPDPWSKKEFLVNSPWVECNMSEGEYATLYPLAVVGLVVYVIGIPLGFGIFLCSNRHTIQEPPHNPRRLKLQLFCNFMFGPYREDCWWFELMVFARRLVIAVAVAVIDRGSPIMPFLMFVILALSLLMQGWYMPFRSLSNNYLEFLGLGTVMTTFTLGLIDATISSKTPTAVREIGFITYILLVANILCFVIFLIFGLDSIFCFFDRMKFTSQVSESLLQKRYAMVLQTSTPTGTPGGRRIIVPSDSTNKDAVSPFSDAAGAVPRRPIQAFS